MSYTSSAASSRRQSMMLPPAIPIGGGIGGALGSPGFAPASFGSDAGPQRHPKPLTAADLHLQLEREQEAVVNRLTRELAALRAQQSPNALEEPLQTPTATSPVLHHNYSSPHIPRHHRTGSNTSTSATGGGVGPNTLSRQNSTRSIRSVNTGGRSSPAIGDLLPLPPHTLPPSVGGGLGTYPYAGYYGYQFQSGLGIATPSANGSMVDLSGTTTESSLAETLKWRHELEAAKRENEMLRKKIKDLEKLLKEASGVEPEGWNGGSVTGMPHANKGRRSRSSSMSLKERGRREKRPGDERTPKKEEAEKVPDVEAKKQVDDSPASTPTNTTTTTSTTTASAASPASPDVKATADI